MQELLIEHLFLLRLKIAIYRDWRTQGTLAGAQGDMRELLPCRPLPALPGPLQPFGP